MLSKNYVFNGHTITTYPTLAKIYVGDYYGNGVEMFYCEDWNTFNKLSQTEIGIPITDFDADDAKEVNEYMEELLTKFTPKNSLITNNGGYDIQCKASVNDIINNITHYNSITGINIWFRGINGGILPHIAKNADVDFNNYVVNRIDATYFRRSGMSSHFDGKYYCLMSLIDAVQYWFSLGLVGNNTILRFGNKYSVKSETGYISLDFEMSVKDIRQVKNLRTLKQKLRKTVCK